MRVAYRIAMLVTALGLGCGKKAEPTVDAQLQNRSISQSPLPTANDNPSKTEVTTQKESKSAEPAKQGSDHSPPIVADAVELVRSYRDNELSADSKYRGKRIQITFSVNSIGRTPNGEAFAGFNYADSTGKSPTVLFLFTKEQEDALAKVLVNSTVTITGDCVGRVNDGVRRALPKYEFHVRVEQCQITIAR